MTNRIGLHIICSPRSASTIIGAAIAQHPSLFLCPELNLWSYRNLAEMIDHDEAEYRRTGVRNMITAGIIRVLFEITDELKTTKDGFNWLYAHQHWSTAFLIDYISDLLSPRHPVYKSTRLAFSATGLQRLATSLGTIKIIHLVRHPMSVISSLVRNSPTMSNLDIHAQTWLCANNNISDFLVSRQPQDILVYRAEDILADPKNHLEKIARQTGYKVTSAVKAAMIRPKYSPFATSVYDSPDLYLDPGFIDNPSFGQRPNKNIDIDKLLGKISLESRDELEKMATRYGYCLTCPPS